SSDVCSSDLCHVHAQTESARFAGRKAQIIDKFIGEIGKVTEASRRIVEFDRVDGLNFNSSDSPFLHLAEFPGEFQFRHRRSEPPPAHQDSAIVGRIQEVSTQALQFDCGAWWPGGMHE